MTTDAQRQFNQGDLVGAREQLQAQIRVAPADTALRLFLAELLMIDGEWERAGQQLAVAKNLDAMAIPMAHAYRAAMECELLRTAVFNGLRSPLILGDPPAWIAALIQALEMQAKGHAAEAAGLRALAYADAPVSPGTANGTAFDWIADADSRIGPVLEVFLEGAYYWVPFERIRRIEIETPSDARDLVWIPAQFTWSNEGAAYGLIPTRYPTSERSADCAVRMARRTHWEPLSGEEYLGIGQRVLTTSSVEIGILDLRELTLAPRDH